MRNTKGRNVVAIRDTGGEERRRRRVRKVDDIVTTEKTTETRGIIEESIQTRKTEEKIDTPRNITDSRGSTLNKKTTKTQILKTGVTNNMILMRKEVADAQKVTDTEGGTIQMMRMIQETDIGAEMIPKTTRETDTTETIEKTERGMTDIVEIVETRRRRRRRKKKIEGDEGGNLQEGTADDTTKIQIMIQERTVHLHHRQPGGETNLREREKEKYNHLVLSSKVCRKPKTEKVEEKEKERRYQHGKRIF